MYVEFVVYVENVGLMSRYVLVDEMYVQVFSGVVSTDSSSFIRRFGYVDDKCVNVHGVFWRISYV